MSKSDALIEKASLDNIENSRTRAFRKGGLTWSQRLSMQTQWQRAHANDNYAERKKINDSILSNPVNIARWEREEQVIKDIETQRLQQIKDIEDQRLQQIKNQEITFNEQVNSGDFNETPITDVNVYGGCSECTGTEISSDPIIKKGYHTMPDGSLMKDSEMEKKPLNNNMKIAGIAAAGVIGLLLYSKGGLK